MTQEKPNIKLFISCHKDGVHFPENPLMVPVQVGCAGKSFRLEGMLHDDEGDNISFKNPYYCELTAQYWAWKNADADYYGFMHYRRYFSFTDEVLPTNPFGDAMLACNDDATVERLGLNEANMRARIEPYDLVVPQKGAFVDKLTMRQQYELAWEHRKEDLDCVVDIIRERHPEFIDVTNRYLSGTEGYFCNMFIMKKQLFEDYSEWLFDILAEHEKRRDFSDYDPTSYRVSGYLAERLCGIYLTWLIDQGHSYTTLQRVLFEDVDEPVHLEPAFSSDNVALVFSANDYYVPYLSTLFQSIHDTADAKRNYDLIVLHTDITPRNQTLMRAQIAEDNISLRFLNVKRAMAAYADKLYTRGHFKVETYYRLLLPELLPAYHKVLYLDADMVVCRDVAPLYDTEVTGQLVAACKDADTAGLYNGASKGKRDYMDNILKIKKPYDYFQAGVIVFNLDEWAKAFTSEQIFDFCQQYPWELLDQDVLNYLCQGRVAFVDMAWNVMVDWRGIRVAQIVSRAPRDLNAQYMAAHANPFIVHYAGPDKPWDDPGSDLAEHFWLSARRSPYYELLLGRLAGAVFRGSQDKRTTGEKVKEKVMQGMIMPTVRKVFPEDSGGYDAVRRAYRKVHPPKPEKDIF